MRTGNDGGDKKEDTQYEDAFDRTFSEENFDKLCFAEDFVKTDVKGKKEK